MMSRPRLRHPAAGFLLVELLVALSLAALVTLLLLNGISLASLGLDRLSHKADQLEQRRSLEELLRRALGAAAALPTNVDGVAFVGQKTGLNFLTLFEDSGPGLYRVELAVEARGGEQALVLTRRPVGAPVDARPERSVLARHVRDFRLAYFGATAINEEASWHDDWQAVREPPRLVRITIDLDDGLEHPPIVVRLWSVAG